MFTNLEACVTVGPPLWSSGQSSWLQIQRPGFDSQHYQKKISGFGTGCTQPREYNWGATWHKSSSSCLENRKYGRRDPSRWPRGTLYPQKLAITSPTSGGLSVGVVLSRSQAMEFFFWCSSKTCSSHSWRFEFGLWHPQYWHNLFLVTA
jgi:hypothetical protein